jgi:hypothetical protein
MPKRYSHVPYRNPARAYSGEKEGRDIVGWLNHGLFEHEKMLRARQLITQVTGERDTHRDEQARVIEILRLYQKSCLEWADTVRRGINSDIGISTKRKKRTAHQALKSRLRRYTFFPQFFPLGKTLSFSWVPIRPDHSDSYGEVSAIGDLANLAEKDLLGHLKECNCGKWIWARFSHQRFCSSMCREREFRSSEKWKEHRRRKAREYYQLHKSGKVK